MNEQSLQNHLFSLHRHGIFVGLCVSLPLRVLGDAIKPCICAPSTVTKYQKRISGPLLDRIDIHVEVPRFVLIGVINPCPQACQAERERS
ncbi:MAG TPA: ATP-binding protein [Anaerolineales bacterium]|nr:ATP-binding protein [Anaerolineales bacterium]